MLLSEIPKFIIDSGIFDASDLRDLATLEKIPSDEEIDAFQYEPEIQELLNAFIGDESTRLIHQLLKAKEFLGKGDIHKAWKLALI